MEFVIAEYSTGVFTLNFSTKPSKYPSEASASEPRKTKKVYIWGERSEPRNPFIFMSICPGGGVGGSVSSEKIEWFEGGGVAGVTCDSCEILHVRKKVVLGVTKKCQRSWHFFVESRTTFLLTCSILHEVRVAPPSHCKPFIKLYKSMTNLPISYMTVKIPFKYTANYENIANSHENIPKYTISKFLQNSLKLCLTKFPSESAPTRFLTEYPGLTLLTRQ